MRICFAGAVAALLLGATSAGAQTLEEHFAHCADESEKVSAELAIAGCTALIEAQQLPAKLRTYAYTSRGTRYQLRQDNVRALADFDAAIRLDPQNGDAYFNRALVQQALGNTAQSVADYGASIRIRPDDPDAYYGRGLVYYDQKNYPLALADLDQAIRLKPNDWRFYSARGLIFFDKEDYARAVTEYGQAIRADPGSGDAYAGRGASHLAMENYASAAADYREAARLNPASLPELSGLCEALTMESLKLDEATTACDAALALDANDTGSLFMRGIVALKQSRYQDAIEDFNKVLDLRGDDPVTLYARGIAGARLGLQSANEDLESAVSAEPDLPELFARYGLKP